MIKKKIAIVFLVLILLIAQVCVFPVAADSATISAPSTAYLGDTITVKVTFQCTTGSKKVGSVDATLSVSPTSAVELVATTAPEDGMADANHVGNGKYLISYVNANSSKSSCVFTFKFKTKNAETIGFHIEGEITDTEETKTNKSNQSTSVKVVDKSSLSGNANASRIILSAGTLVPAFNPKVTTYNVNVDYSVTEVLLSVTTEETKAGISIEGSKKMKVGSNTRTVVITAPNGTVKKYTINIYRASQGDAVAPPSPTNPEPQVNPYEITVDGQKLYMINDYSLITAPNGFSPAILNINEKDIPVLQDVVTDRVIVYATNEDDTVGGFYLYDKESEKFSQFRYLTTEGFTFIVLDHLDKVPTLENYYYTTIKVDKFSVNGFKYNASSMADFDIFYAETANGEKGFYRYDAKDGTVQRAVEFAAEYEAALNPNNSAKDIISRFMGLELKSKIIVISGAAAILIIIILIIIVIVKSAKQEPEIPKESLEAAEEQEFMEGFGEVNHLFLNSDYEEDDSVLDDDFRLKDNDEE